MRLTIHSKLGDHRGSPRLWIESKRLERLGMPIGTPLCVSAQNGRVQIRPGTGEHTVSGRRAAGGVRPIIDLNSRVLLDWLSEFREVRIDASHQRIDVSPSARAFAIRSSLTAEPPFRVLECFAGGGTMTAALKGNEAFRVVAGLEIEPDFTDVWQAAHPEAALIQSDIRMVHGSELPQFDVLLAGIPCTSHSGLGRAKKSLAGCPELGDTGDLFIPVLNLIAQRMPLAIVLENVPSFGTSLAGQTISSHLTKLGYSVSTRVIEPHLEWGEPSERRRWVLVATIADGFSIVPPGLPHAEPVSVYLDPPNPELDEADALAIAGSIQCLNRRLVAHQERGNGFGYTLITGEETTLPTLTKSYGKVNAGPFVSTPYGPRLLRKAELERIHGCRVDAGTYTVSSQILGQGVQTRVFAEIFRQLGVFLWK